MSLQELEAGLEALDPTVNPYRALAAELHGIVYLDMKTPFHTALRVAQVIYSVSLLASLFGLALFVLNRELWLFRFKDTSLGPLAHIHTNLAVTLVCATLCVMLILETQLSINAYYRDGLFFSAMAAVGPIEFAFLLLFIIESYAAASSIVLRYSRRWRSTFVHTWHLHALFGLLIVAAIAMLATFGAAVQHLRSADHALSRLVVQLNAVPWSPGQGFAMQSAWMPDLETYFSGLQTYAKLFNDSFSLLASFALACMVIAAPSTILHARLLRSYRGATDRAVDVFAMSKQDGHTNVAAVQRRHQTLRRAVITMTIETLASLVIGLVFAAYALYCALKLSVIQRSANAQSIFFSIGFFLYASMIVLLLSVISIRQIEKYRRLRKKPRNVVEGIQITVDTARAVDDASRTAEVSVDDHWMAAYHALQVEARSPAYPSLAFVDLRLVPLHNASDPFKVGQHVAEENKLAV